MWYVFTPQGRLGLMIQPSLLRLRSHPIVDRWEYKINSKSLPAKTSEVLLEATSHPQDALKDHVVILYSFTSDSGHIL